MHLGRDSFVITVTLLFSFFSVPALAQDLTDEDITQIEEEAPANAEVPVTEAVDEPKAEAAQTQAEEPKKEEVGASEESGGYGKQETLTYPEGVDVEKSVYYDAKKNCNCEYTYLMPYAERRSTIGFTVSLGYSTYNPKDYKPDFVVNETLESYYDTAESPLLELTLGLKWNNFLGSLALEAGAGRYTNDGSDNSSLVLTPVRTGLTLALDTLFKEPYIVPYATVGAYTTLYEESLASQKVSGNTSLGLFYAGGLQFQLNWLDEDAAISSYDDTGLENTFLFLEARSFVASDDIPNVGTPIQLGGGLKIEY